MRNYDRVHPRKPEGIDERKASIVGGCKRPAEGKSPEAAADHARDSERHKSDPARTGVLFRAERKSVIKPLTL